MSEEQEVSTAESGTAVAERPVAPEPVADGDTGEKAEPAVEQAAAEGDTGTAAKAEVTGAKGLTALQRHVAARAHLTDEVLEQLGENAPAILEQLKSAQDAVSTQFAKLGAKAVPKEEAKPAKEEQKAAKQAAVEPEPEDGEFSLGIDFEAYEDDAADALRKVEAKMAQFAKTRPQLDEDAIAQRVMQRLEPLLGGLQQQHLRDRDRETDDFFGSIKEDFVDVYGDIPNREVQDGSDIAKNRTALLRMAMQIHMGMQEAGEDATWKESLSRALSVVQRDRQKTIARREILDEVKGRQRQISPSPARRAKSDLPKGPERAIKNLLARYPDLHE